MPAKKLTDSDLARRKIKAAMAGKELTQEKIAKRFGVDQGTVSNRIKDINRMNVGNFKRLCHIVGLDPADLLKIERS